MFDIGFWEMALIAVIALLVVGPRELPALIRGVSGWMARARRVAGEFKAEFTREVAHAEELKRLVEREAEVAELHKALEEARSTIPLDGPGGERKDAAGPGSQHGDARAPATGSPSPRRERDESGPG